MDKSTFRQAAITQKRLNRKALAIMGGVFVAVMLTIIIVAVVLRTVSKEKEEEAKLAAAEKEYDTPPSTATAPTQIRYADLTEGKASYSTGSDYIIINQGNQNIRVNQDGSVDIVDAEGNVIRTLTGSAKDDAVAAAVQIMEADVFADMALSGLEGSKEQAKSQSSAETAATESSTAVTPSTTPDYREQVMIILDQYGLTEDDLYRKVYVGGSTPATFWKMVESGYLDPKEYISAIAVDDNSSGTGGGTATVQTTGSAPINADIQSQTPKTQTEEVVQTTTYPDWMNDDYNYSDTLAAVLGSLGGATGTTSWEDVNGQSAKQSWLDSQQGATRTTSQLTKYDLAPGTVINMTLITGLNTDMPGQVVGQIRGNVYDSLTGTQILIPKGSKVVGTYSSGVTFGQKRVAIIWNQIITPDGYVFSGLGFNAVDGQGFSGAQDQVFNHIWETFGGALLASLIDFGAEEAAGYTNNTLQGNIGMDAANTAANSLVNTAQTVGQKYVSLFMNKQPTIVIRPGAQLTMIVNGIVSFERKVTQ